MMPTPRAVEGAVNREARVDGAAMVADPDVLTVADAAALLRVSRNAIYDAIGRGEVPHRRIGRVIRLSRQGLMQWLSSCGPLQVAQEGSK